MYERYEQRGAEFVPHYLELLAAGGSRTPEELGQIVDVDLADPGFWDAGLDLVERQLRGRSGRPRLRSRVGGAGHRDLCGSAYPCSIVSDQFGRHRQAGGQALARVDRSADRAIAHPTEDLSLDGHGLAQRAEVRASAPSRECGPRGRYTSMLCIGTSGIASKATLAVPALSIVVEPRSRVSRRRPAG